MISRRRVLLLPLGLSALAGHARAAEPVLRAEWQRLPTWEGKERAGIGYVVHAVDSPRRLDGPATTNDLASSKVEYFLVYSRDEIDSLPRLAALESGLLDVMSRVASLSPPPPPMSVAPDSERSIEALSARVRELETEMALLRERLNDLARPAAAAVEGR